MRSLLFVALCVVLSVPCAVAQDRPHHSSVMRVTYRFENPAFVLTCVGLEVDESGVGSLNFTRKDLGRSVERPVRVERETMRAISELLADAGYFTSQGVYQSATRQFPHLGTYTLTATKEGAERTVTFNYTEVAPMARLVELLRGITTREVHAFDLETSMRYAPLAIPALIQQMESDLKYGRIAEPKGLLPILQQVVDDPSLPLIARNRAERLSKRLSSEHEKK